VVRIETSRTIADGIATKQVGALTFPLIESLVDEIVTVTEEETAWAIHVLLERQKVIAEGAGAVPLAALMSGRIVLSEGDTAVLIVSGGNIDVNLVSRIIDRGLLRDGRLTRLMIQVGDRPGNLARLADCVARTGANVLDIAHRRAFADIRVGDVEIVMHLETRGRSHVEEIVQVLEGEGLTVEEDV